MIYDCFLFYNELDVLEIRLHELDPVVDYFVIVESSKTFSGLDKAFIFEENKERYEKFLTKIIYIKNDIYHTDQDYWYNEEFQRNLIKSGLSQANENDTILIGDVDEIPSSNDISDNLDYPYVFLMSLTRYYLNFVEGYNIWKGTVCTTVKALDSLTPNEIRHTMHNIPQVSSGWHFSWLGNFEDLKYKLSAFSHDELNNQNVLDEIENDLNKGIINNTFFGNVTLVDVDDFFPSYLKNNISKYSHIIFKNLT